MKNKKANVLLTVLIVLVAIGFLVSIGAIIKHKVSTSKLPTFTMYGSENDTEEKADSMSDFTFQLDANTLNGFNESMVIKDLEVKTRGRDWIYWTWTNPDNTEFGRNIIYIDGRNVKNSTKEFYNATNLNPAENHTIKICVMNIYGRKQTTCTSDSAWTLYGADHASPNPVEEIKVITRDATSITWSWINPDNEDFEKVMIYLNGRFVKNVTTNNYKATGLSMNTLYTITIHTVDDEDNVNTQDVTNTTRTCLNVGSFGGFDTYCV